MKTVAIWTFWVIAFTVCVFVVPILLLPLGAFLVLDLCLRHISRLKRDRRERNAALAASLDATESLQMEVAGLRTDLAKERGREFARQVVTEITGQRFSLT